MGTQFLASVLVESYYIIHCTVFKIKTSFLQLKIVDGKTYSAHEYAELEMKITELQHEKPVTSLEVS